MFWDNDTKQYCQIFWHALLILLYWRTGFDIKPLGQMLLTFASSCMPADIRSAAAKIPLWPAAFCFPSTRWLGRPALIDTPRRQRSLVGVDTKWRVEVCSPTPQSRLSCSFADAFYATTTHFISRLSPAAHPEHCCRHPPHHSHPRQHHQPCTAHA